MRVVQHHKTLPLSLSFFSLFNFPCKMARLDRSLPAKSIRAKSSRGRTEITDDSRSIEDQTMIKSCTEKSEEHFIQKSF